MTDPPSRSRQFRCDACESVFERAGTRATDLPAVCPVCHATEGLQLQGEHWSAGELDSAMRRARVRFGRPSVAPGVVAARDSQRGQRNLALMGKSTAELLQLLYGVTDEEIEAALEIQKHGGGKLGSILVELGVITEDQLMACLAILSRKEQTLLSHAFLAPLHRHWWGRRTQLWLEALVLTLFATGIMAALRVSEGGLLSLFLVTAALSSRFEVVLADSDRRRESFDILAIFSGLILAYAIIGLGMGSERLQEMFGFVLRAAAVDLNTTLSPERFSNFDGILQHNLMVAFAVAVLVFVYRGHAFLLSLAWNAAVWGVVLTLMVLQTYAQSVLSPAAFISISLVALLPHLVLEILGYIVCALTFVGISRAYLWYGPSLRFLRDLRQRWRGLSVALSCLLIGATLEAYWAPRVLRMVLG